MTDAPTPAPEPVELAAEELAAAGEIKGIGVIEMTARLAGSQQCSMGNHVWTPWLRLPNGSYVICRTTRVGCSGHEQRYDT